MCKNVLPPELFDVLPALYPRFTRLLDQCGLTAAEVFALSCVKHSGRNIGQSPAILLSDLKNQLISVVGYEQNGGGPSTVVNKLFDKGWLERRRLTPIDKRSVFGTADGSKAAVVLSTQGMAKLEQI